MTFLTIFLNYISASVGVKKISRNHIISGNVIILIPNVKHRH